MKLKKGNIYEIRFWDHCLDSSPQLVECRCFGVFDSQDKDRVSLLYWITDNETFNHCRELSNIAKKTILEIRELTYSS